MEFTSADLHKILSGKYEGASIVEDIILHVNDGYDIWCARFLFDGELYSFRYTDNGESSINILEDTVRRLDCKFVIMINDDFHTGKNSAIRAYKTRKNARREAEILKSKMPDARISTGIVFVHHIENIGE